MPIDYRSALSIQLSIFLFRSVMERTSSATELMKQKATSQTKWEMLSLLLTWELDSCPLTLRPEDIIFVLWRKHKR